MKIEVVTMWYNEEFLAPFFLDHYAFADRITLVLDADTTDRSKEIASRFPNVHIEGFKFPDMMDDTLKVERLNKAYEDSEADWVILVDSDEFVFIDPENNCLREVLEREKHSTTVIDVVFYQVYRHRNDRDLNHEKPAVLQRRHGDPDTFSDLNKSYRKPIVVRTHCGIQWVQGNHAIRSGRVVKSSRILPGSHWMMADPCFCVERRVIGRRDRQSRNNIEQGMTWQHHKITKESVEKECESHLDDPLLF